MGEARRILAVVFDAVGTLLLLREPVGATYARLAAAHGVRLPAGRLDEAFRRVLAAAPPNVPPGVSLDAAAERERGWWRERVRETFRAADGMAHFDDFDAFFGRLWAHYAEASAWRLARCACLDARARARAACLELRPAAAALLATLGLASAST
jgi:putative hydrolase of the HAD superfamily